MKFLRPLLVALSLTLAVPAPALAGDPVMSFESDDPVMNGAISDARRTLPMFYDKLAASDLTQDVLLLKVAMPYERDGATSHEHIWVAVTGRDGETFDGLLANDPVHIDYAQYDPVRFTEADVSDWLYYNENGLIEGAFTMRVMLKDLPEDRAEEFRKAMAPPPEGTGPYE